MHTCPDCNRTCTCRGDVDDICFGDWHGCACSCEEEWERDVSPAVQEELDAWDALIESIEPDIIP